MDSACPMFMQTVTATDSNNSDPGLRKLLGEAPMFCIEWDESLSVGVPQVDDHHKYLVALLNKTYNACTCADMEEELKTILNELVDYSQYHFTVEERLMETHDYPELGLHKLEHGMFSERIIGIRRELCEVKRNPSITLIDVAMFLGNWLSGHIMKTDKRFGIYLVEACSPQAGTP